MYTPKKEKRTTPFNKREKKLKRKNPVNLRKFIVMPNESRLPWCPSLKNVFITKFHKLMIQSSGESLDNQLNRFHLIKTEI